MRHIINTDLGEFTVHLSYQPTADNPVLQRLTETINSFFEKSLTQVLNEHRDLKVPMPAASTEKVKNVYQNDTTTFFFVEAALEKELFESNRVGGGTAPMVVLSIRDRVIDFPKW